MNLRPYLTALLCALALPMVAAAQEKGRRPPAADRAGLLERAAESRSRGLADATLLIYEIADFQCPFCARFALDAFHQIDSAYITTGRAQWVFVNLPMPAHGTAWIATEAALCAGAVSGRFWVMHDRLFVAGQEWIAAPDPGAVMARYAKEAGVEMEAWEDCVAEDRVAPLILQDVIFGSRVTGTPTFVVTNRVTNTQKTVVGVKSFAEWREVLDGALRGKE